MSHRAHAFVQRSEVQRDKWITYKNLKILSDNVKQINSQRKATQSLERSVQPSAPSRAEIHTCRGEKLRKIVAVFVPLISFSFSPHTGNFISAPLTE